MEPGHRTLRTLGIGKPIEERVTNLEIQVDVHTSRMDSEAGTRSRANSLLHGRLDTQDERLLRIEKLTWAVGGGLAVMNFLGFAYVIKILLAH
jgi:hypothetical protein